MAVNTVSYQANLQAVTERIFSPAIWGDCPVLEFLENPTRGTFFFDDFTTWPYITTPTITTEAAIGQGYKAFGSSGGTLVSGGARYGTIVATETDNNEGIGLQTITAPFQIIRGDGKLWFECRLKTNSVANDDHGFFVGLMELVTLSATVPIAAAGTLTDNNFVGFHRLEGDGDQIDTVYKANTVTQVSVQTDALSTALTADTYIKLGFVFDPYDANYLTFYVNNLALATRKQIPSAAGTDFPNDVTLALTFAMLCASANDAVVTMDWWACAQESYQGA